MKQSIQAQPRVRLALTAVVLLLLGAAMPLSTASGPRTTLHYAPNGNFSENGRYMPGLVGFNLADVQNLDELITLPRGVKGLVWVGQCAGVDAKFLKAVRPYAGNPRLFGYYLMDDPDPRPTVNLVRNSAYCPAANLKAESDWIHEHAPGARTFIVLMNLTSRLTPSFSDAYAPDNSHTDLFGLDPYPCRTEIAGCDLAMIERYVVAAETSGVPRSRMIPIYQAFGNGDWHTDGGGAYILPNTEQIRGIWSSWGALIDAPEFDFAYSWGAQKSDIALEGSRALRDTFRARNSIQSTEVP